MQVETSRFGAVEIDDDNVIAFPQGIPGFEHLRRFFTLPVEGNENIRWLQAVDNPAVALLLIDPFKYFKGYSCDVPDQIIDELEIAELAEALVLTTITVPPDTPSAATANLLAPIIINTRLHKGRQVILSGSPYSTKHRLFPEAKVAQAEPQAEQAAMAGKRPAPNSVKKISGQGGV